METATEVENDLDEPTASVTDQEKTDEMQQLLQRVKQLELENVKIQEEFGHQRAKMKELYVQKEIECKREIEECSRLVGEVRRLEVELGEAQSQLLAVGFQQESDLIAEKEKCQSEISSLQQLIQETVEESSSSRSKYENEIRRLRGLNEKLDTELQKHRSRHMDAGLTSSAASEGGVAGVLSPGMITAVTKSLARKVVSLAPSASTSIIPSSSAFIPRVPSPTPNVVEPTAENLEDCMRKAQEDAEVLRSLVIPLEQEIKALKDKLRSTDEQLQWYRAHTQVAPPSLGNSLSADQLNFAQEAESNLAKPGVSGEASLMDSSLTSLTSLGEGQRSSARSSPIQFSALQEAEEQRKMEVPMSPGPRSLRSMTPVPVAGCDMCANYEAQLQKVQLNVGELERQNKLTQRAADRYREDLAKETEFRKEMENKWSEKKEEHKMQVERLSSAVTQAEQHLAKLQHSFEHTQSHLTHQLGLLTREREEVHKRLDYLQDENEKLVGKYSAKAAELQDESINLPDNVEELQVLLLQTREDLITSKVGKEAAEEQRDTLQSELHLVRHEMGTQLQACSSDNEQIRKQLKDQTMLRAAEQALQITVAELKKELAEMRRAKAQVERAEQELRNRVASLQEDLDNNEATQQDFVQLSQSLQMELERLREAEKEVRWQHEDDVDECAGCRAPFSVTRRKVKGVEEVSLMPLMTANAGAASPVTISKETALQHAAQLEHNIRFLREQHHIMLTSLHKEVEALRQRNRELQFQLVMSSAASSAPISLLQDIPNSPEDDTRPRVILSPRQPNLSPLQVEILEKDLAELRIDLKEERDKNQQLYGIVQEQQRKIELLKTVSALTPRYRDAQCQAGAAGCAELGRKLEETQRTVKTLRRENEEQRKELTNLKSGLSRSQQSGSRDGYTKEAEVSEEVHVERAPSSGQHRFPPLHNAGYWQQQQHRPGMEFSGSSRSGERRGQRDKDTSSLGSRSNRTTLPALHGANMYVFSQNNRRNSGNHFYNNNNNNNGGSRQGYYRATAGAGGIRAEEPFEGIQGRKYRGGRGQRERQLQ